MGLVETEITLKNNWDIGLAEAGYKKPEEIRQMTTTVLVDTGAWTLVINEATREKLGLRITGKTPSTPKEDRTLANGQMEEYDLAGPVEILWKDRRTVCEAMILPDADDILLGAIPLEAMDLIVNPGKQEVVGAHGDQIMHKIY